MAANGSAVNDVPSFESMNPLFTPKFSDQLINGLWFLSLVLSLLTAFVGVIAKQWLYQYGAVTSGTPRDRALVRQARNLGLQEWRVPLLIAILPVILHISLFLFFVGLVTLLSHILPQAAYVTSIVAGLVYLMYLISHFLPLVWPRCPYRSSLTPLLYWLCRPLLSRRLQLAEENAYNNADSTSRLLDFWRPLISWAYRLFGVHIIPRQTEKLWRDEESADAHKTKDLLEAKAVSWLYASSYNPSAQQIALEALSALQPSHYENRENWDLSFIASLTKELRWRCERLCDSGQNAVTDVGKQMEIYLRATIRLGPFFPPANRWLQTHIPDDSDVDQYLSQHITLLVDAIPNGVLLPTTIKLKNLFSQHTASVAGPSELRHFNALIAMLHAAQCTNERDFNTKMLTTLKDPSLLGDGTVLFFDKALPHINDPPHSGHAAAEYRESGIERRLSESVLALPHDDKLSILLRRLLFLVAWNEYHNSAEQFVWDETNSLLKGVSLYQAFWLTPEKREAAKQILAYFVCTKTFECCASKGTTVQSARQPEIVKKTVKLLRGFGIFPDVMASTSSTVILAIFLVSWELASRREQFETGFSSRQDSLSRFLSISFAGTERDQLYQAMIELDAIPRLYALWHERHISLPRGLVQNIPRIAVSYAENVSVEDDKQMDYIHQDHNLYNLCHIILVEMLHQDDGEVNEEVMRRLTRMKPDHPSWTFCYERLIRHYPHPAPERIQNVMVLIRENTETEEIQNAMNATRAKRRERSARS